jgi:hypothetical protein
MLTVLPHGIYTTKRFGPSTNTKGTITPGTQTAGTVSGTMSSAKPSDIARLEEGKRSRQCYKLITTQKLQIAAPGGLVPDQVQVGTDWFEISDENPWLNGVMPHYEYLITKIENP